MRTKIRSYFLNLVFFPAEKISSMLVDVSSPIVSEYGGFHQTFNFIHEALGDINNVENEIMELQLQIGEKEKQIRQIGMAALEKLEETAGGVVESFENSYLSQLQI